MKDFQDLNSPLQFIDTFHNIELWVKRDDLIHPAISGNKWRKLKYYLEDFKASGKSKIATFGGAFSNHIAATAAMGEFFHISTTGYIRGEEIQHNPTLDFARTKGMQIIPINREDYSKKDDLHFLKNLIGDDVYLIPEGGKGVLGLKGCVEILDEVKDSFDVICCSAGTTTTFTGLLMNGYPADFRMYPALKGALWLKDAVEALKEDFSTTNHGKNIAIQPYTISENYHFGGYGKVKPGLIRFMNSFYDKYGLPLDPVYTGKMFYGILEDIREGKFPPAKKILAIHTGGLQGIKGMNTRLSKMGLKLNYES